MGAVVIILIVGLILIIAATIALAIIFAKQDSSPTHECKNQNDCAIGYVCTSRDGKNVCRAGIGSHCTVTGDCADTLICLSEVCSVSQAPQQTVKFIFPEKPVVLPPSFPQNESTQSQKILPVVIPPKTISRKLDCSSATPLTGDEGSVRQPSRAVRNTRRRVSISSSDDENNSEGEHEDLPFDVRSDETDRSVSTPCQIREGNYYCRTEQKFNSSSPVIDVCSYSNFTAYLLQDYNIICDDDKSRRTRKTNSVQLVRIITFNGYLYGLSKEGKMYFLSNDSIESSNWTWTFCNWTISNITHISSTYDGLFVWLQTASTGYLYNSDYNLVSQTPARDIRRIYGKDVNNYVDLNPNKFTATTYPSGTVSHSVYDCALSYHNELVCVDAVDSKEYNRIVMVNWKPYYIRNVGNNS